MAKKLIVLVHGICTTNPKFHEEWKQVIAEKHDLSDVMVAGLWWDDVLKTARTKYPLNPLNDVITTFEFPNFEQQVGDSSLWQMFEEHFMDVLVYVGLPNTWQIILNECILKLNAILREANVSKADTILIGHSLGAAMLPQLVWYEHKANDNKPIEYHGLILLASPLGFKSPKPDCGDFLQRMGEMSTPPTDRKSTLAHFANAWSNIGQHKLHFISNKNDIVCSDVEYKLPIGGYADLIPVQQGFSPEEISLLDSLNSGCVKIVSFGEPFPLLVAKNHEVTTYLRQDPFHEALDALLRTPA